MCVAVQSSSSSPRDNVFMQNFIKHFIRLGPGIWTCVEYGEYRSPKGRVQITPGRTLTKGKNYMGLDLAGILEQEFKSQNGPQPQQNQQQNG